MSNDLMDRLREVGELNDRWSERQATSDVVSLYVVSDRPETTRNRYQIPAAVAAVIATVALVGSLVFTSDDGDEPASTNVASGESESTTEGPSLGESDLAQADRLEGEMPDGTPWSVEVAANSTEVCFDVGTASGCGLAMRGAATTIDANPGGYQLVYGLMAPLVHEGSTGPTITGPPSRIDLELVTGNGTVVPAEHLGDRIWATILPAGTGAVISVTQHWDDGTYIWITNEGVDAPPHVDDAEREAREAEARRQAEDRREAEEQARRAAERQRQLAEQSDD